jgi:D-beta-D-heptose 7-phosphate kinase / D-beta-D-heptose 1-phosphate adenosyltransferase
LIEDRLITLLSRFSGKKVMVIGDIMLDEQLWCRVERISPEAPVPIAEVTSTTHVPGGAGNVAANISALGGTPILIGVIGKDGSAQKLLQALKKNRIDSSCIVSDGDRPTILKSRVIAANQQVVRVDRETKEEISSDTVSRIIRAIKNKLPLCSAVIISDYGKGTITKKIIEAVMNYSKAHGLPVAVDPKGKDYSKYKGATVITPNKKEASIASLVEITDETSLNSAGKKLLKISGSKNVLITRGKEGMSLFSKNGKTVHIPSVPREVFDITGAGDTVISTVAIALASGAEILDAVILSNHAASVVITKVGTQPVRIEELRHSLSENIPSHKKIRSLNELKAIVKKLKSDGCKIVFTNGCFDILHIGHVRYLEEAKKLGDILIVGLNSDLSVKKLKGRERPFMPESERAELVAALGSVDYVTIFHEGTPEALISEIRPDIHVKGGDYKSPSKLPEAKIVNSYGGKVVILSETKGRSTTGLIDKIRSSRA